MPEFLLEVGCEELPASFVEKAYSDLQEALCKELTELGLFGGGAQACGTPRRLIVSFPDVKARQEDSTKEQRGPSLQAAFDANGEPTKALLGFCKSQGVEPSDLRCDEQYVWVTKHIAGRPTPEILAEILPRIILGLSFEKSMRWGASRARFARPIRWILAAFDGKAVEFDVEGVHSALISYGHRFYAPDPFEARSLSALESELKNRFVEIRAEARKASIIDQVNKIANGATDGYDDLLDENTFLTEWPTAIVGSFPESYLELPEPVRVTAMAKHERMFPVRGANGELTNQFVFIRNSGEDETVRKGCEWVLGARFNDARFFYEQDQKLTMDDFLDKTEGIVFQAQLGSVRQRADRLANLAAKIAEYTGGTPEAIELARKAGLYAKADLATGLVSELSSLQGVIGGEYGSKSLEWSVCNAIRHQYAEYGNVWKSEVFNTTFASSISTDSQIKSASSVLWSLQLADNLDKLAGYLGLGLAPTGSSDPFGLRRSVTTLINISVDPLYTGSELHFDELLLLAAQEYVVQGFAINPETALNLMSEIFASRYPVLWSSRDTRRPFEAALLRGSVREMTCPASVKFRLEALEHFKDSSELQTVARPINLTNAAKAKGEKFGGLEDVSAAGLSSADGSQLLAAVGRVKTEVIEAQKKSDSDALADTLKTLLPAINAFFDNTMVMAEDPAERFHRLSLANATAELLLVAGDFTKLEG